MAKILLFSRHVRRRDQVKKLVRQIQKERPAWIQDAINFPGGKRFIVYGHELARNPIL